MSIEERTESFLKDLNFQETIKVFKIVTRQKDKRLREYEDYVYNEERKELLEEITYDDIHKMSKVLEYYTKKHINIKYLKKLIKLHVIPTYDRLNEGGVGVSGFTEDYFTRDSDVLDLIIYWGCYIYNDEDSLQQARALQQAQALKYKMHDLFIDNCCYKDYNFDDDDLLHFFEKIIYDGFKKTQVLKFTKMHESLVDLVLTKYKSF